MYVMFSYSQVNNKMYYIQNISTKYIYIVTQLYIYMSILPLMKCTTTIAKGIIIMYDCLTNLF